MAYDWQKGETLFSLEFRCEGEWVLFDKIRASNRDLKDYPMLYKHILDEMVERLEKAIEARNTGA